MTEKKTPNPRQYSRAYTTKGAKGKHIQTYIDRETTVKVNILAKLWKCPISDIYKRALQELLERHEKEIDYDGSR